jgi:hypothetical protein
MDPAEVLIEQARMITGRLERVSVDSIWARRSSGQRGALLRWIELYDNQQNGQTFQEADLDRLQALLDSSYVMLTKAARERLG